MKWLNSLDEHVRFLDRIYGTEIVEEQLINHAISNNWAWRRFQSNTVYYNDESVNIEKKVGSDFYNYIDENGCAYIDTLHFYDANNNIL